MLMFSLLTTQSFRSIRRRLAMTAVAVAATQAAFFSGRAVQSATAFGTPSGEDTTQAPVHHAAASKQVATKPPLDSRLRSVVKSKIALVVDAKTSADLFSKDADKVVPIASITKLMTAMVVLDAKPPMGERLKISNDDRDLVMGTSSRLRVGYELSREDMLHLALMSSENRAAAALSRYYPGGRPAFIKAMNTKAAELGMAHTHFVNPNGLTNENVSTAFDLAKLVRAANQYPLIREFSTDPQYDVHIGRYALPYFNSDRLVGHTNWDIELQKTGFTNAAGRCLVMWVNAEGRSLIMVFLDGYGKFTRFADARRVVMQLAVAEKQAGAARSTP